jgi:uncharacterized protein (TIGR03089 family)
MPPTTCADLLRTITSEPGRPRITWYGDAGERVELSGAVLENWVNKTTNLLVEEFDVGPGTRVLLDLPPHWRSIVWAFAVWRGGACIVCSPPTGTSESVDLVVTDLPERHLGADPLVVISLPALARRYDGSLPPGAVDAASAVMTYGDTLGWVPPPDPVALALDDGAARVTHGALIAAPEREPSRAVARVLHVAGTGRHADVLQLLRTALDVLANDGSVVVVSPSTERDLAADPGRRTRLIASEGITDGV